MNELKIISVEYGKSTLSEQSIFQNGTENKVRPIVFLFYLIRTNDRLILTDVGCDTMPGFVMRDFIGPVRALQAHDVSPEEITDVIITHAHHDHIAGIVHFPNAEIYIQKDEYESGKDYFSAQMKLHLFEDEITVTPEIRVVKIGGHSIGSCVVEFQKNDRVYVLAGDECYLRECLIRKIPTGASVCTEKSKAFIEKYSSEKYTVLLFHDPKYTKEI